MSLATHHSFIVAPQQLQRVPEVAAGFCLSHLVGDCPVVSEEERKKITIRTQYKQTTEVYWCQNTRSKKVIYSCRQQQWSRAHHIYTLHAEDNEIKSLSISLNVIKLQVIIICSIRDSKYNFEKKLKRMKGIKLRARGVQLEKIGDSIL